MFPCFMKKMTAPNPTPSMSMQSILEKDKLTGANFLDWHRNLRIVLKQERKLYVLDDALPEEEPASNASKAQKDAYNKHLNDSIDVTCLMLACMNSDLQKKFEEMDAFMNKQGKRGSTPSKPSSTASWLRVAQLALMFSR